ncbi:MAG TPA: GNAT family N-acetyltransferase [Bacteriovoracaceae bacterium]|nr:GNAT family N-acetyltransferase [Bacteriovoracaceae bacterium]
MPDIIIRAAAAADIPSITGIYNEAVLNGVSTFDTEIKSVEDRMNWFTKRHLRYPVIVAEEKGRVVGWASLNQYSDRLAYADTVENSLYVHPSAQGRGAGKLLMKGLIEVARENKLHTILARISDGNELSIHLHERFGFRRVGIMKEVGHKFGRLLDVHLMQIIL